jgi:crossover junction endodeoxyribonuclease RuvC
MMQTPLRIIGLDPGLRHTGWGVVTLTGAHLQPIAAGVIDVPENLPLAERLKHLHEALAEIMQMMKPDQAAVEETFSNSNARSTLKLGMARGVVMAVPALFNIPVHEYAANAVKKTVVGSGHATKDQIQMMVRTLLPTMNVPSADANDALAIAICHAHHVPHLGRITDIQTALRGDAA